MGIEMINSTILRQISLLVLGLLVIVGCSGPQAEQKSTSLPLTNTSIPTSEPLPTETPTNEPTPRPTATQTPEPTPTKLPAVLQGEWITFTIDDGLMSNDITSLMLAPDGKVWVGTDEGVSYYDNNSWISFTTEDWLAHNEIGWDGLAVDPDGKVWEYHLMCYIYEFIIEYKLTDTESRWKTAGV